MHTAQMTTEKPRILHVDDNEDFLNIVSLMLKKDFDIISAGKISRAIDIITGEDLDAIILDYEMDDMNGLELLDKIKKIKPDIPVIFYTGQGNESIARKAFLKGAADYFTKEIRSFAHHEKLVNSIKRAIQTEKARKEKKESEEKYYGYINNAPDGIFVFDGEGKIREVNPAAQKLTGYTETELIGKVYRELVNTTSQIKADKLFQDLLKTGKVSAEITLITKHGEEISTAIDAVELAKNKFIAFCKNISKLKQAKKAVEESNTMLKRNLAFTEALLFAIPTPVFFKDAEGRYFGCNRAFTEFMGVSSQEMKGKTVYELWPGEHAKVYHKMDMELLKNPEFQVYEFMVRNKEKEDRNVIFAKNVFYNERNEVAGIVGAFMDITEQKNAEARINERLRFQKLISAISSKFINVPSQEIDNQILETLELTAKFFDVDRCTIFQSGDFKKEGVVTHSWCKEGVEQGKGGSSERDYPYATRQIKRGKIFCFSKLEDLPEEASKDIETLIEDGNKSTIAIPLKAGELTFGALVIDSVFNERYWTEEEIKQIKLVSEFFSSALIRKITEISSIENKELFDSIVKNSKNIIFKIDAETANFLYITPIVEKFGGFTADEMIGKPFSEFIHPDDLKKINEYLEKIEKEAYVPSLEYRIKHKDGSTKYLTTNISVIYGRGGNKFYSGIAYDITERKKSEDK